MVYREKNACAHFAHTWLWLYVTTIVIIAAWTHTLARVAGVVPSLNSKVRASTKHYKR
jgi:hypothetical protein